MNNPRRYGGSRGDYFHNFFWPLLISLLLHIVVLGNFTSGQNASASSLQTERVAHVTSLHLVRIIPRSQLRSRESGERLPQQSQTERAAKSARFLRSTAKKSPNVRAKNAADLVEDDDDLKVIDSMEASEYRLALARTLVRLRANDGSQPVSAGEIFLELVGRQGSESPVLQMKVFSVARAVSDRWHGLMQAAVDQTPIPATWSGRSFKLSLKMLVAPIQSAEGSACNSCS